MIKLFIAAMIAGAALLACTPRKLAGVPMNPAISSGSLVQVLEANRWTLESATDGGNRRNDALLPVVERPFVFTFSGTGLTIQGGCNSLRGSFQIDAEGRMQAGRMASTMMACEPVLMNADAALSALIATPLRIELVKGANPRLRLVAASNETLQLTGQATPESLYGPATLIFFEVAPRQVACQPPFQKKASCLQVREWRYDELGLPIGAPGEWRPLHEDIEGFKHTPGERNVLRVKRFQRNPVPADASSNVYVLDLLFLSEVVAR